MSGPLLNHLFKIGDQVECLSDYYPDLTLSRIYIVFDCTTQGFSIMDDARNRREFDHFSGKRLFRVLSNIFDGQRPNSAGITSQQEAEVLRCTCGCEAVGSSAHRPYCDLAHPIAS